MIAPHDDAVVWTGAIAAVKTMADGGGRVTLDIPDDALAEIIGGMVALRGQAVRVVIVPAETPTYGRRDMAD